MIKYTVCAKSVINMKRFDVLVLGVETCVGQQFYKDLREKYPLLTVATIAKRYSVKVDLPTHFVPVDFEDHEKMCQVFSLSRAVVACDLKYVNERVKRAARGAQVAFIESVPRNQLLIEGALEEVEFKPASMIMHEMFSFSLGCVSSLLRAKQFGTPKKHGEWTIDEDVITLSDPVGLKVRVRCEFVHWLWAWIFWFVIFVMRILARIVPDGFINGEQATGNKTPVTCRYTCTPGQVKLNVHYANEITLQSELLLIKTVRKVMKHYHGQLPRLSVVYVWQIERNSSLR